MTPNLAQTDLRERLAYRALEAHFGEIRARHMRELFAEDPERGQRLTAQAEGLLLDYSKNRVTDETLRLLVELAEQSGLRERIDAMFAGEHINITEDRAVLHVALRAPRGSVIMADGVDVVAEVHKVLDDVRIPGSLGGVDRQESSRSVTAPVSSARRASVARFWC